MPTPLGHALGGLVVGWLFTPRVEARATDPRSTPPTPAATALHTRGLIQERTLAWWCAAVACLPDVDFLWGRHNMETHSLGFALLVGAVAFALTRSGRWAAACALAVGTHVLFDWLGSDDSPPLGVMALWPFSAAFFFAEAYVFDAVSRRYWLPGFVAHNALAVAREIVLLGPVAGLIGWRRWRKRPA